MPGRAFFELPRDLSIKLGDHPQKSELRMSEETERSLESVLSRQSTCERGPFLIMERR